MASTSATKIGAKRGGDYFHKEPEGIRIAEEDPAHPGHAAHMARVADDNPEFQLLVYLIDQLGWETGSICYYYRDPPNAPEPTAATARRRITAARKVNQMWKARKDPRYPIMVPIIRTDDPIMAMNVENAARAQDPPLVLARRFLAASKSMSEPMAAASVGLRLADARDLVKLLSSAPELQAAVNAREVPIDIAKREMKKGAKMAAADLAAASESSKGEGGKVDGKKLRSNLKSVVGPGMSARQMRRVAAAFVGLPKTSKVAKTFILGALLDLGEAVEYGSMSADATALVEGLLFNRGAGKKGDIPDEVKAAMKLVVDEDKAKEKAKSEKAEAVAEKKKAADKKKAAKAKKKAANEEGLTEAELEHAVGPLLDPEASEEDEDEEEDEEEEDEEESDDEEEEEEEEEDE